MQLKEATAREDEEAAGEAQREMNALVLFKGDMGGFVRIYTFLSQIFDYGDTSIGC